MLSVEFRFHPSDNHRDRSNGIRNPSRMPGCEMTEFVEACVLMQDNDVDPIHPYARIESPKNHTARRFMTKGVKGAADSFEYGMSWVTARRATLVVHEDRLECGDWTIPHASISEAVLFKTRQVFIPCYILKIRTASDAYQFGLNPSRFWEGDLPFRVVRQKGRLHYSKFSIIMRIVLAAALVWYFFLRS